MRKYTCTLLGIIITGYLAHAQTPSASRNFVMETTVKEVNKKTTSALSGLPVEQANRSIQYLDGLGRPVQTVQWKGSPLQRDIVQPLVYDAMGREEKKYLPYTEIGSTDGSFKPMAISRQTVYYSSASWDGNVAKTPYPYSQTVFEPSPLNRVVQQGAPGMVWQPASPRSSTIGRTVIYEYNTTSPGVVRRWAVTTNGAMSNGSHPSNKVYKHTTKDENWASTDGNTGASDSFTDLLGQVVLKRVWKTSSEKLETYYVYDDFGNLRYVLPPAVTDLSFTESDAVFDRYIYGYHYDGNKRLIKKKVPGKGWEYMVYNRLDQVALTQDANQRAKSPQEWTVNKYDAMGRIILTGTYVSSSSLETLQAAVDAQPYQWEETISSGIGYTVTRTFPMEALATNLVINYYDTYAIPGIPSAYNTSAYSIMLKRLPTATLRGVLGTADALWTVMCYDNDARLVRTYNQHYAGSVVQPGNYDEVTNNYNFAGQLTGSIRRHYMNGTEQLYVANTYGYDHMGRKTTTGQKTGTNSATVNPTVILSKNNYNEIGQLKAKQLHSSDSGDTFRQATGYAYNERGWLKNSSSPQFGIKLGYDTLEYAQYNGNISTQQWGNSYANQFDYRYDRLNRLTNAVSTGVAMSEVIGYDNMGNINSMNRDQVSGTYSYTGNRLNGISGGLATGSYSYDANGNALTDGRTGVTLSYNQLNLPTTAVKAGLNIAYTYDATGTKLRKTVSTTGTTTGYVDGIHYVNGAIEFVQTEEGRALNNGGDYSYQYNLSDHLGNVRYSFDIYDGAVRRLQSDDYYAFGLRKSVSPVVLDNNYLYNGKELQDELGQYDYGARFYDPIIARWNVIDPLAEKFYSVSPYNYTDNNPVNNIDPNGMETYYGQEAQDMFRQIQNNLVGGGDGPDPKKQNKPKKKESGTEASKKVLKDNWFLRIFAGREVMNAGRALDAYDEEGWQGYINTSISNAHKEIGFDFGNGQYVNPWARTAMGFQNYTFTQTAKDGNLLLYSTKIGNDVIEFGGDFSKSKGVLTISNFDIDGNLTNKLGFKALSDIIKAFGKSQGVEKVIIQGAKRTTGANPGKVPSPLTFNIDK